MYPPKLVGLNANRKLVFGTQPGVNVSLDSNVSGNQQTTLAMKNATNNQTAYSYKGVYSGTTQYFKGENVLYGQTFWLALQNALGQTPATGSASWQAIASYNAFQGAWSSTTSYVVGDEVTSGGNFWVALAANTNSLPSASNANWQIAGPVSLANVADDPVGTWRKVGGVGTGNLIGFKSLVGDTSGDNTTSLVDTNTKSFLHATMSTGVKGVISSGSQLNVNPTGGVTSTLPYANHAPSVTTTIVNTPDGNGSYLGHGVVFQPHIHANQIGWGHFIGDTSGNYTGNLVDGLNLRFLHGAMSGPTQGTINPNVDTFGSYLGHGTVFQPHISARQIGFGHFKGDTSGNYSTSFVDGANLRFLHGAMSGATQSTVAGTADSNGSYLQHGTVFNPHLTAGAIGFKNFLGDTSGDTTTNLIDAANKRFLHGAMSTGVQGVISSGAQLTVNPSGGVSGTLPYTNHDISFRNVISIGSQLNVNPTGGVTSTLPYANHDTSFRNVISSGSQLTVNPTGGVAGTLPYLNHDVSFRNVISSGSQVNVNPTGGVTGNLPQPNHDPAVLLGAATGAQANLIPDSSLLFGSAYASQSAGAFSIVNLIAPSGGNAFKFVGTGVAEGYVNQGWPVSVVPGAVYSLSAWMDCTNVTSGNPVFELYNFTKSAGVGTFGWNPGQKARLTNPNFTVPNTWATTDNICIIADLGNCTITNGQPWYAADPKLEAGSLCTAYNLRAADNNTGGFLHGALSPQVKAAIQATADSQGSYITHGTILLPHLVTGTGTNQISQDGVPDGITRGATLNSVMTGNVPDLAKGILGKVQTNIADDATYLRWKATQQTAMSRPGQGHINDPTFTSVSDFWSNVGTASSGVFTLPAMTANQGLGPAAYNRDGRGNINQIAVQPGDVVVLQLTCNTAATGTVATSLVGLFVNSGGLDLGVYPFVTAGAASTTPYIGAPVSAPANAVGLWIYFQGKSGVSGGNNASVSNPVVRINHETVIDTNAKKAFVDFTNNVSGGHVGKTQSNIADDSNAKMLRFGTLASRPAAGTAGRIYHASDAGTNGITYRDTGSAWVGMAVGHLADINGTLDNTSDGSSRFAVAAVDPNKKALIDYSQPGHANANLQYFGGIQSGYCYDGQAITFNPTYSSIPLVFFPANGMTYSSGVGSATSQSLAFTASSLTASGFTASLKLVTGGTLTARSDNFGTVSAGTEYSATLTNAPAYNNTYTVNWTLSLGSSSSGTVYIRETSNTGTILFSKNYATGQNGAKSTPVTWSGATGTSVIDISLSLDGGSTGTISASTVTFTSGTAPSTNSAVPSTAPILWIALPQT